MDKYQTINAWEKLGFLPLDKNKTLLSQLETKKVGKNSESSRQEELKIVFMKW
jgi:hypothetical protein